jgi:hypothetical protein
MIIYALFVAYSLKQANVIGYFDKYDQCVLQRDKILSYQSTPRSIGAYYADYAACVPMNHPQNWNGQ